MYVTLRSRSTRLPTPYLWVEVGARVVRAVRVTRFTDVHLDRPRGY